MIQDTTNTTIEVSEIEGTKYVVETVATVTYKDRKKEVVELVTLIAQFNRNIASLVSEKEQMEARLVEIGYVEGEELETEEEIVTEELLEESEGNE